MENIRLTSWYGKSHIIYKVLYIPGGCLGFLPSTVLYTLHNLSIYALCHDIIQIKLLEFHLPPFSPPIFFARRPMLKHNGPGKRNDLGEWWDDQSPFWKHFSNQAVQWKVSSCFYVAHLMTINGYQWNIDHFEMHFLLNIDFFRMAF